jgi:thiol-disulfide isomerase/thioredoxin
MTDEFDNPVKSKESKSAGFAVASLILGIISIVLSMMFPVGGVLALIGLILGGIHIKKRTISHAMAMWGVSLSVAGLLASVGVGYLYYHGYRQYQVISSGGADNNPGAFGDWQGVQSPDFNVTTLDGKLLRLSDLRGKRVIVDIWATWCPPCQMEIPHFVQLGKDSDTNDLAIVGISNEDKDVLVKFVKEKGINYSIASATDLPSPYKDVQSIPTTFFVDRNGVIQTIFQGYHDYKALKNAALAEDYKGVVKNK